MDQTHNYLCMAALNYKMMCSMFNNNIVYDCKYNNIFNESELIAYKQIGVANQASLLSSLYSLYVVPYERLYKDTSMLTDIENYLQRNIVIITNSYNPPADLHYHLRNAVAHAKIEFLTATKVKFNDSRIKKQTRENIEFIMTTEQIKGLIDILLFKIEDIINSLEI